MNKNNTRVTLNNARLSYCNVLKPVENLSGDLKYSTTVLLPKTDIKGKAALDAAINAAIENGVSSKWGGIKPPAPQIPIYDGDGVRPSDGAPFGEECKGHWVFTASANPEYPPLVVGLDREPIIDASEVYSGMYAAVAVNFYPYAFGAKRGVGCGLDGIMKIRDGEPLGGARPDATDLFGQAPETAPANQQQPQVQGGYQQQQQTSPYVGQIDPLTGQPMQGGVWGI